MLQMMMMMKMLKMMKTNVLLEMRHLAWACLCIRGPTTWGLSRKSFWGVFRMFIMGVIVRV